MSSMLTPARPSASAISATVPGRFSTATRSSQSSPPTRSASSRRRRSSRAAPCQAATRSRVAGRGSARRPRGAARTTASTSRATASRLVAKMSPQIAGFAPATRVVSRKLGPTSGRRSDSSAARRGRLLDEHVGDHVRQVADRRHQPVVGLGVDRLRAGAEVGDRPLQAVVEDAARALGRRQVPARALEQVGAGVLDPGGLGAGERVAADEPLRRRAGQPGSISAPLVEPTSVTTACVAARRERLGDERRAARRPAPRRRRPRRRRPPRRPSRRPGRAPPARAPRSRVRPGRGRSPRPRRRAAASPRARSSRRSGRRRGRRSSARGEPHRSDAGRDSLPGDLGDRAGPASA